MKFRLLLTGIIGLQCLNANAQSSKSEILTSVAQVFYEEAQPFFKEFAASRYKKQDEDLTKVAVSTRLENLKLEAKLIEVKVKEAMKLNEKGSIDKRYLSKVFSHEYDSAFPGLPPSFWQSVEKKINSL
jgi:hypothetical protein